MKYFQNVSFIKKIIFTFLEHFCQSEYRAQPKSDTLACSGTANLNQVAQGPHQLELIL